MVIPAVVVACTWANPAHASLTRQEQVSLLNDGLAAFDRGNELAGESPTEAVRKFREAADAFGRIVDSGVRNGKLYYNLGNAQLKSGQIGRAIASYRRAQELMPTNARLEENLRYARSLCRYDIPESTERAVAHTVFFWHYDSPLRLRFVVGSAAFVVFWGCLTVGAITPRFPRKYPAVAALLVTLTLAVSVAIDFNAGLSSRGGVITADETVVRKGNGLAYAPQFAEPVTDGLEFDTLDVRDDWVQIRLPDGNDGWVPSEDVELF